MSFSQLITFPRHDKLIAFAFRKEFHIRFPTVDIRNNSLHTMAQHSGLDTDIRHGLGHCRTILEVAVKLLNQGLSESIIVGHIVRNILGNLFLQYCDCE